MKRTQNALNDDGKRESRLPESIRNRETAVQRETTGRLDVCVCLIESERLISHIPHGFFLFSRKNKSQKEKSKSEPLASVRTINRMENQLSRRDFLIFS